jgi:hypothetical protein
MEGVEIVPIGSPSRPFPFLKDIWNFFLEKGSQTVFFSVGSSESPLAELEIGESLGCPIHMFEPSAENQKAWEDVKTLLKTRKTDETTSEFAKVAAKKWVLAKNIHIHSGLPFFSSGKLGDTSLFTVEESLAKSGQSNLRVDLLKVDLRGQEDTVLSGLLSPGFRPSLILVNWSESPNESYKTMIAAGNLTMIGYTLLGRIENRCLYYFTGMSLYETTDWYTPNCKNPLLVTLLADYDVRPKQTGEPASSLQE